MGFLEGLYILGRFASSVGLSPETAIFAEVPDRNPKEVLSVIVDVKNKKYEISLRNFENIKYYGYVPDETKGPKYYSFSRITSGGNLKDLKKVKGFLNKLIKFLGELKEEAEKEGKWKVAEDLRSCLEILKNNFDKICEEITELDLKSKERKEGKRSSPYYYLFTIEVKGAKGISPNEEGPVPIGSCKVLLNLYISLMFEKAPEGFYCLLCGRKIEEMPKRGRAENPGSYFTKLFPYAFLSFDKRHAVPYFNSYLYFTVFPVCKECLLKILLGRKFLREKLRLQEVLFFAGKGGQEKGARILARKAPGNVFWELIPEIPIEILPEIWAHLVKDGKNLLALQNTLEDRIRTLLKEEKIWTCIFHLLFIWSVQGGSEKPLYLISDIPPLRLREIYRIFDKNFSRISVAYPIGSSERASAKGSLRGFLEFFGSNFAYLEKLIKGYKFKAREIREIFLDNMREEIRRINSNNSSWRSQKLLFINSLVYASSLSEMGQIAPSRSFDLEVSLSKMGGDNLISDFREALKDVELGKKAAFSLGVLTGLLARKQVKEGSGESGKAPPILKRMLWIKMTPERVKQLVPEITAKMVAYGIVDYPLTKQFSEILTEGEEEMMKMPSEDITYYFCLGLLYSYSGAIFDAFKGKEKEGGEEVERKEE